MLSLIFSMFSFSLSMSISPGPVNLTILNSSMNYGLKRTFGFISGATFGFTFLLAAVCFGLYQVIILYPILLDMITILGTALLVWIGWKILNADATPIHTTEVKVDAIPTFTQGALMQWLNPKAWIAAVSGTALFASSQSYIYLTLFVLIYFVVCYVSLFIWGIAGQKLAQFLNTSFRVKILNLLMGAVLILISLNMAWQHFL